MLKLLIATHNRDKLKEIAAILPVDSFQLFCMDDFPDATPVDEDRDTIQGNAIKKALETAKAQNMLCVADDTGLFVEALDGAPGVYAARYAGEGCSYRDNRLKLLSELQGNPHRTAHFTTSVALAAPDGLLALSEGSVAGSITTEERGDAGFGYDAVFEVSGTGLTFAQMDDTTKNTISHRGLALRNLLPALSNLLALE